MFANALEPPHLLLILVIALIVFGPSKLPQLGKSLGEGIRALKHGINDTPAPSAGPAAGAPAPPSSSIVQAALERCGNCGRLLPEGTRFCGGCGRPRDASSPAAAAPSIAPLQTQSN